MNILDCLKEIEAAAEIASPEVREIKAFPVGHHARQGDVYLHRLPDDAPHGKKKWGSKQVAIGTTKGARHVARGPVEVWESVGFEQFPAFAVGPVVVASGPWDLSHAPDGHAWLSCPAGVYQVVYQREGMRRVQD